MAQTLFNSHVKLIMVNSNALKYIDVNFSLINNSLISFFSFLRSALLRIARANDVDFTVIPVNGSGALAMESTLRTMLLKKRGKVNIYLYITKT